MTKSARYVFCEKGNLAFTAGIKAPADAFQIAVRNGFRPIAVGAFPQKDGDGFFRLALKAACWRLAEEFHLRRFRRGDTVFLPAVPAFCCRRRGHVFLRRLAARGVEIVFLVHDIPALILPLGEARANALEDFLDLIRPFSRLIVPTAAMRRLLEDWGVAPEKMTELGIFDYLTSGDFAAAELTEPPTICFAGSLERIKAGWIAAAAETPGITWRFYGPHREETLSANDASFAGCFPPDELPAHLKGSFGLVWDGDAVETCNGLWGEYERLNAPHKLSLYLAAGLPVIVWKGAALAEFVRSCGVGLTVAALRDIPAAIAAFGPSGYNRLLSSVRAVGSELRAGKFLSTALMAPNMI